MKSSPTMWLALVVLLGGGLGGATAVLAQEGSPATVRPTDVQNGSSCEAKNLKHLLAATDPLERADQEWNLKAAEAYGKLAALGFREC